MTLWESSSTLHSLDEGNLVGMTSRDHRTLQCFDTTGAVPSTRVPVVAVGSLASMLRMSMTVGRSKPSSAPDSMSHVLSLVGQARSSLMRVLSLGETVVNLSTCARVHSGVE